MKKFILILLLMLSAPIMTVHAEEKAGTVHVIEEALEINPNIEMLVDHSFQGGVKVKSIKIKQVEIMRDTTVVVHGDITEGEPKGIGIIIEITDMKGNTSELFGYQPLQMGDYTFRIKDPRAQ